MRLSGKRTHQRKTFVVLVEVILIFAKDTHRYFSARYSQKLQLKQISRVSRVALTRLRAVNRCASPRRISAPASPQSLCPHFPPPPPPASSPGKTPVPALDLSPPSPTPPQAVLVRLVTPICPHEDPGAAKRNRGLFRDHRGRRSRTEEQAGIFFSRLGEGWEAQGILPA